MIKTPFTGREATTELFEVLFDVLKEIELTHEFADGDTHVFYWRADIHGRNIEGSDLLRFDEQGKISEIKVMIRPLVDIAAFAAAIGPPLAAKRRRMLGPHVRAMTLPLSVILALVDIISTRLIQRP